jgi:hypothetical protein
MSSFKSVFLLSLAFVASPAWSAGYDTFHNVAISWQAVEDPAGYVTNIPHVDLQTLQVELSQQKALQQQDEYKYQKALQENSISPGKLMLAAILPGGFAYLAIQKMANNKNATRLEHIKLFLAELSQDRIALQPHYEPTPVMLASIAPNDFENNLLNVVNVIEN